MQGADAKFPADLCSLHGESVLEIHVLKGRSYTLSDGHPRGPPLPLCWQQLSFRAVMTASSSLSTSSQSSSRTGSCAWKKGQSLTDSESASAVEASQTPHRRVNGQTLLASKAKIQLQQVGMHTSQTFGLCALLMATCRGKCHVAGACAWKLASLQKPWVSTCILQLKERNLSKF